MRILILSFYYPPDIGATSIRPKSIVDALIKEGSPDLKIDVITTMPNRYQSFDIFAQGFEDNGKVSVKRIRLPKHKNGMLDQAWAFVVFSFEVRKLILKKNWDIVIATSSRLMTASLGAWVAKRTGSSLYLDIRDLFIDSMDDIFKKKSLRILIPLLRILEKWTFHSADKINIVSPGFIDYFKKITPNLSPSVYTNGVDEIFLKNQFSINQTKTKPLILYTGNIGDGQGLHKIIPEAANELKNIQFRLIGDGGARMLLTNNHLFKSQTNIEVLNPVLRSQLINEYQKADILFLHLNDYKALHKVLPSKIFEYAATGKPILAGVSGYAAEFLRNHVKGAEVFNPCDIKSMKLGLQKLLNGPKIFDRQLFSTIYNRENIMKKMAKDILLMQKKNKFLDMSLKLLLIQLNELNFDVVDKYLSEAKKNKFTNLRVIKDTFKSFNTYAEDRYENLEPWIQWASLNLGKEFNQHKIFRLGDIVNFPKEKQIFEKIEDKGFKVGAISPMNAENRLKNPSYFIPDPWTDTFSDNSGFSKRLSIMLKQTVNDNSSGKLSFYSVLIIIEAVLRTLHYKNTLFLLKLIFSSLFKSWKKSLVLDYLMHLIHIYFLKKKLINFSSIFFNAGAHIQHHYFYNTKYINSLQKNPEWYIKSSCDPFEDMLDVYDQIIGDYLKLNKNENQLLISTGLRQVPYNMTKFYYRLKSHSSFLKKINIKFLKILPRMTRDFEIIFDNDLDLKNAKNILENIKSKKDDLNIFDEIEKRDRSLFVTLTYPHEVKNGDYIFVNNKLELNFFNETVFVAIKNGMHDTKGYVFYSPNSNIQLPERPVHISKLHDMILNHF